MALGNAFFARYGKCVRKAQGNRKRPTSNQKDSCYQEAKDYFDARAPKRRKPKKSTASKSKMSAAARNKKRCAKVPCSKTGKLKNPTKTRCCKKG